VTLAIQNSKFVIQNVPACGSAALVSSAIYPVTQKSEKAKDLDPLPFRLAPSPNHTVNQYRWVDKFNFTPGITPLLDCYR
jgi:hypothetical protein